MVIKYSIINDFKNTEYIILNFIIINNKALH